MCYRTLVVAEAMDNGDDDAHEQRRSAAERRPGGSGYSPCGGCGKRGVYEWPVPGSPPARLQYDVECRYCRRSATVDAIGTTPRERAAQLAEVPPP
jgi:hypothetical protein